MKCRFCINLQFLSYEFLCRFKHKAKIGSMLNLKFTYTVTNIIPVHKRLGESAEDFPLCRECNSNYWNKYYNSRNWVGSQKPYQLLEVLSI